jgi:hypothetical protein
LRDLSDDNLTANKDLVNYGYDPSRLGFSQSKRIVITLHVPSIVNVAFVERTQGDLKGWVI